MTTVNANRQPFGISVLGGPTTVIDLAGWRFVVDPTFDDPGEHGYLTKTAGPAVGPSGLGLVDVVLISHDEHLDNLDAEGRRFALAAPRILTNPGAAKRLGPSAQGLAEGESVVWQREATSPRSRCGRYRRCTALPTAIATTAVM